MSRVQVIGSSSFMSTLYSSSFSTIRKRLFSSNPLRYRTLLQVPESLQSLIHSRVLHHVLSCCEFPQQTTTPSSLLKQLQPTKTSQFITVYLDTRTRTAHTDRERGGSTASKILQRDERERRLQSWLQESGKEGPWNPLAGSRAR